MSDYQVKTAKGYCFFEVASAFQKAVRRCNEQHAMYWGIELHNSNYHKYAWKRMIIMASEDVGLGEPSCIVQMMALKQSYDYLATLNEKSKPERLPFTHAILLLVRSRKSRYVDHAITAHWQQHDALQLDIPDCALDCHTRRGKAMGRGLDYFYAESAKISNANKLRGEEELEQRAMAVDKVHGVTREDACCDKDPGFSVTAKKDGSLTLF